MSLTDKIIVCFTALIVAFALGRYSKTVDTTSQTTTQVEKAQDKEEHTVTQTVKKVDGTVVTTITDDTSTKTNQITNQTKDSTAKANSTLNISALVANDFKNPFQLVYGVSITKQLLGPITVGAFGLTNQTIGVSIGVNF